MKKLQVHLGKRISSIRRSQGLTSEKLAYGCNLSKGYLSDIENGKRLPTLRTLYRIAKSLRVQLKEFF